MSVFGADLEKWPGDSKEAAMEALRSSEALAQALSAEKELELALMTRQFEESSPGLSDRIIASALSSEKTPSKSFISSVKDLFSALPIPSPALALPLILVIGIVAGYLIPTETAVSEPEGVQVADVIYNYGGLYE